MGHYRSEKEAAYWALRAMEKHVPAIWDDDGMEYGTMIYRIEDPWSGYWYTFSTPEPGKTRLYEPPPPPGSSTGWTEAALVHTHPNDTGISDGDIKIAIWNKYTVYMVTQSGAYWYEGKPEYEKYGKKSHVRYGTMWGQPYPWSFDNPLVKTYE